MSDPLCRRCAVEITEREDYVGDGHCFVCASLYGPSALRRPFDEAIREMGSSEYFDEL